MKKVLCVILSAVFALTLLTACGKDSESKSEPKQPINHKLYVRDDSKSKKITATFIDTTSDDTTDIEMTLEREEDDCNTFSCTADAAKYNKVSFNYDGLETMEAAFNEYVSGWFISSSGLLPYTEGVKIEEEIPYATKTFPYRDYEKEVYIWTPKDYDAKSKDKYSVIYLADGQKMFDRSGDVMGSWNVAESVTSMMSLSSNKAIIVGIATPESNRAAELTPEIGEVTSNDVMYQRLDGKYFADFVCDTLIPYIEKNYNVYTDAAHNSISGSSLGGLESFYIGMTRPDKIGNVGAMSPTIGIFSFDTWKEFFKDIKFDENSPFVYFYAGNQLNDNGLGTEQMAAYLKANGYPEDKMFKNIFDKGAHSVPYWRVMFPEFLKYAFRQSK